MTMRMERPTLPPTPQSPPPNTNIPRPFTPQNTQTPKQPQPQYQHQQTCGRILLPEADRRAFLRAMRSPHADALRKAAIFKKVVDKCKKASYCFDCKAANGKVRAWAGRGLCGSFARGRRRNSCALVLVVVVGVLVAQGQSKDTAAIALLSLPPPE
jgi:hypothetical protein